MVEPYAGRNSPIVEAFHRIRNRVASLASPRETVHRSPFRPPRRQRYSRGVLFFLPAIFTQSQDIELASAPLAPPRIPATVPSRTTSRATQLRPPEKPRYTEDVESIGDLRRDIPEGLHPHDGTLSSRSSHEDLVNVDDLPSRPHSRNSSSSRSRSTSRPLVLWDS